MPANKDKTGWIILNRSLLESAVWNTKEPFTIRDAWIDLLLSVNYEDKEMVTKHGKVITIPRGSMFTSIQHLADRWHWSPNKVRRQTEMLKKLKMITMNGTADGTLLTVVKYRDFQDRWRTDGTADGTSDGTTLGTRLKEYKEIKEGTSSSRSNRPAPLEERFAAIERNAKKEKGFDWW